MTQRIGYSEPRKRDHYSGYPLRKNWGRDLLRHAFSRAEYGDASGGRKGPVFPWSLQYDYWTGPLGAIAEGKGGG